jgi:hypothetical protein
MLFAEGRGRRVLNLAESLLRAGVAVVRIPVAVVADTITMGGVLTDRDESYTASATKDLVENLEDAASPRDKNGGGA